LSINLLIIKNGVAGAKPPTGTRGGSPTLSPGMDAGRVCPKALHDAEPTKHTQPFTTGKGFGVRDREFALFFIKTDFFYKLKGNLIMDKAKIDRINYLARKSRERELTTEEKEEQLELRNEYRASFKRGLMSELDRVYVVDDKGKQQKLIKDNENK